MKLNKFFIILCLTICLQINSAVYKAVPLICLSNGLPIEFQCINFDYKIFNKVDCKKYLGRDKIISKGYLPIQIAVTNNSDRTLSFALSSFNIDCISHEEVAQAVHFNIVARVVGWAIGGLFIWPLIIGAIVEGVQTPDANRDLNADYAGKSLNTQIIKPYSSINGLIFVEKKKFDKNFSFTLVDSKTNETFKLSTNIQQIKF